MHNVRRWAVLVLVALVVTVIALPVSRSFVVGVVDNWLGGSNDASTAADALGASASEHGSLVSSAPLPGFSRSVDGSRVDAARVVYRSTSGDTGEPTVVSGAVFAPKVRSGDLPIISFGHGTTGIDEPCAPSLSETLLGLSTTVAALTAAGYAVAVADYQGLGTEGVHPYTDAKTAGLNVIDVVRALRGVFDGTSTSWAAVGGSQGGGAVWAANELAASYAPELNLVGALAISPAADVSGLVAKAQAGTLTPDQRPAVQAIVESLARLHSELDRNDYRTVAAEGYWDVLSACSGPLTLQRAAAAQKLGAADLKPHSTAAADRLTAYLKKWALPQSRLSAPLFVWYGGNDTLVDADWTRDAIQRQCRLGGTVQWQFEPNKGHGEVALDSLLPWVTDRFQGKELVNACA